MHGLLRSAGFTLLTLALSCGAGAQAQALDTRIGHLPQPELAIGEC
jgi:hypothetical protein